MERLTEKVLGFYQLKACGNDFCKETCEKYDEVKSCNNCPIQQAIEKLAKYEELEDMGELLIVPQIPKNKTIYWIWGNEIMPAIYKRVTSCVVDDEGKPHIMCEMRTKKDRTFIHTYRRKPVETTFKAGDKRFFYADDIGKTIFMTKEEAAAALKENARAAKG